MPDLDQHCERVNRSALVHGAEATMDADAIIDLVREGAKKFAPGTALYVKPMYWAEAEGPHDRAGSRNRRGFCLSPVRGADAGAGRLLDDEVALPPPDPGIRCRRIRRPAASIRTMPACCARRRRAASTTRSSATPSATWPRPAPSNVFMAKDGVVHTPAPNGTFLNGITRQRVIQLLREDGVEVVEAPCATRISSARTRSSSPATTPKSCRCCASTSRDLQPGPFYRKARDALLGFRAQQGRLKVFHGGWMPAGCATSVPSALPARRSGP